jgi:hypothetical protein
MPFQFVWKDGIGLLNCGIIGQEHPTMAETVAGRGCTGGVMAQGNEQGLDLVRAKEPDKPGVWLDGRHLYVGTEAQLARQTAIEPEEAVGADAQDDQDEKGTSACDPSPRLADHGEVIDQVRYDLHSYGAQEHHG